MTDCKGLFGKIFGHCFEKYLIKPKISGTTEFTGSHESIRELLLAFRDQYEIRCKRCGAKPEDEK